MATKYRGTHTGAWEYLLTELRPDVALVQEVLSDLDPSLIKGGQLFWSEDRGTQSGTAIWVRSGLDADRVTIQSEGSYIAAVRMHVRGEPTLIVSVHVGPRNYRKHLRILINVLSELVTGQRFVVGGDFNAARQIDAVYKGKWFTRFFDDLARREFCDCHWRRHGKEVQSFWGQQARHAYQCDHFLVDTVTDEGTVDCKIVDNAQVRGFSDHGPIYLETLADAVDSTG